MANPYAVVFFGALFPQFIDTAAPIWPQLLILGVTYLVVDGVILMLWGWAARRTLGRVKALTGQWINRVSGALMLGAARATINALPENQRDVILLICVEELSYKEAADVLETPVGTVMSRLARARLAIAEKLGINRDAARSSDRQGDS